MITSPITVAEAVAGLEGVTRWLTLHRDLLAADHLDRVGSCYCLLEDLLTGPTGLEED